MHGKNKKCCFLLSQQHIAEALWCEQGGGGGRVRKSASVILTSQCLYKFRPAMALITSQCYRTDD